MPVESVAIKGQQTVVHGGASFQLTAEVLPNDATNKAVIWESNHPDYISVDNQGNVTIKGWTEETITITAISTADNTKTASWQFNIKKATVTDIIVTPAEMTLTLKNDGSPVSANIVAAVEPAIAAEYTTVNYYVTSGSNYVAVDENGLVMAIAEGNAVVTVSVGDISKEVNVTVEPAPVEEILVTDITVTTDKSKVYKKDTNVTIDFELTPYNTTDTIVTYKKLVNGEVVETNTISTNNGKGSLMLSNVKEDVTIVFSISNSNGTATYLDSYPVIVVDGVDSISFENIKVTKEQNTVFTNNIVDYDTLSNSIASWTYSSDDESIASVDPVTGQVTAKKNGVTTIRVTAQPKYDAEPLPAEFQIDVLGHIDWTDENSIQGTYDIVFFGTNTNNSGLAKAVISNDCSLYNNFKWNNDFACPSGTGGYEIPDGDFVGRALVRVEKGIVTINTKVGFIGNKTIQSMSPADQYQYTNYPSDSLSSYINTGNVGTLTGRHLTEKTTSNDATYYLERDVNYTGMTKKDIVLFTKISKEVDAIFTTITVYPDTRLVLRKISSQIIPMSPNTLSESPFDVLQSKLTLESGANIDASIN